MADEFSIRLFGGLQIERDARPLSDFVSNKAPALLAYLAVTRRPHQRDALAGLLWGGLPEAGAKNNLRQALSNLRQLAGACLEISRDTVQFNPAAPCFVDYHTFLERVRPEAGLTPAAQIARLAQAADLYSGDFLQGFFVRDAPEFEEWMLGQRTRCRELALQTLHGLAEMQIARGQTLPAIDTVTRLLALDPWREEAHRQLMLLQARSGQLSAALRQYETCRKILRRELGVEPSVYTTSLYERIRSAQVRPGGNLDEHIPDGSLAGRGQELEEITVGLLSPGRRLLTLNGMGGSGKTRLALEAARRLSTAFINGVYFVPLADTPPGRVVHAIAAALRYPLKNGVTSEALFAFLRQKELLLVLDDFEHLAASPPALQFIGDLLRQAPDVRLLVTSRQRLNLRQEWVLDLHGLEQPAALELFCDAARRVAPGFTLTPQEEPAVLRICRAAGGLPLAITLAAAWRRAMTCAEIAARMERDSTALASPAVDMPARHRSLQAVFDHSWSLLSPDERACLAALAVFSGGFTGEAARAVSGASDLALAGLVDKSLVQPTPGGRFDLHGLVRQAAAARLEDRPATERRHAGYFAAFVREREERLMSGPTQQEAIHGLLLEGGNIRRMWAWALEQGEISILESAVTGFFLLSETSGRLAEGAQALADAGAILGDAAEQARLRGRLLVYRANLLGSTGQYEQAQQVYRQGIQAAEQAGDVRPQAFATRNLGFFALMRGERDEALALVRRGLELYRSIPDPTGTAEALVSVGVVLSERGEYEAARASHLEAVRLCEEIHDEFGRTSALDGLGAIAYFTGNLEQAREYYRASYQAQASHNYLRGRAISIHNIACIECDLKNWPAALQAQLEALDILSDLGHQEGMMHCRHNLARIKLGMDNLPEALGNLEEALKIGIQLQAVGDTLEICLVGVELLHRQGAAAQAVALLDEIGAHPGGSAHLGGMVQALRATLGAPPPVEAAAPRSIEAIAAHLAALLDAAPAQ